MSPSVPSKIRILCSITSYTQPSIDALQARTSLKEGAGGPRLRPYQLVPARLSPWAEVLIPGGRYRRHDRSRPGPVPGMPRQGTVHRWDEYISGKYHSIGSLRYEGDDMGLSPAATSRMASSTRGATAQTTPRLNRLPVSTRNTCVLVRSSSIWLMPSAAMGSMSRPPAHRGSGLRRNRLPG